MIKIDKRNADKFRKNACELFNSCFPIKVGDGLLHEETQIEYKVIEIQISCCISRGNFSYNYILKRVNKLGSTVTIKNFTLVKEYTLIT